MATLDGAKAYVVQDTVATLALPTCRAPNASARHCERQTFCRIFPLFECVYDVIRSKDATRSLAIGDWTQSKLRRFPEISVVLPPNRTSWLRGSAFLGTNRALHAMAYLASTDQMLSWGG